ncbi:MAG: S41 family peptidase [Bdellovibrionales bacterium]
MQKTTGLILSALTISFLLHPLSLFAAPDKCVAAVKLNLPQPNELKIAAEALIISIENHYGPLRLKSETIELKWKEAKSKLLAEIAEVKTQSEALRVFTRFLLSMNDAHVSVGLPSNYEASLPLQFNYVPADQAIYLTQINPMLASLRLRSGELPPLGAELVKINGQNIFEFQSQYLNFNADGNKLTNRAMFARSLSRLREARGFPLSLAGDLKWTFTFKYKDQTSQNLVEKEVILEYNKSGVPLIDIDSILPKPNLKEQESLNQLPLPPKNRRAPEGKLYSIIQELPLFDLPKDFQRIVWPEYIKNLFDEKRIMAGTFMMNGKRVGLLRVATYDTSGYNFAGIKAVVDYLIRQLEMKSDYLIFDQMSNPGGAVVYSDMIVEALTGKIDLNKHMRFKLKPNHNFVRKYAETIRSLETSPLLPSSNEKTELINFLRDQYEKIHAAFRKGEDLTEPVSLLGDYFLVKLSIAASTEAPKQKELFNQESDPQFRYGQTALYTKPVFMLIDHFSFSGGDATPANLKDYGRVTLIGTRTAGAGGTVEGFNHQILDFQFTYKLTTSLMYRPTAEQKYVENFGVIPDYVVEPTLSDYLGGFKNYFRKVIEIAEEKMRNK